MNSQQLAKFKLPDKPGVYFFVKKKKSTLPQSLSGNDRHLSTASPGRRGSKSPFSFQEKAGDEVLYIGKATSLRDRTKSYFSKDLISTRGPLVVDMVFKADSVKFEETDSVLEALILEANLIKKYQPYYNTKEKDDKSFNYLCITKEAFPKVLVLRGKDLENKSSKNFFSGPRVAASSAQLDRSKNLFTRFIATYGPFTSGPQLREAMKIIRKIFPFIDAQSAKKDNAEFYRQLGLAPNIPFVGKRSVLEEERSDGKGLTLRRQAEQLYKKNIRHIKLFFEGKKKKIISDLKKEMMQYAKKHQFERAGETKRQIFALEHINDVALLKRDFQAGHFSLGSSTTKFRVEAYDIAHMSGKNMVGVMTVVEDSNPVKSEYRKFNIKTQTSSNDTGALLEVLERRFAHTEWPMPSLIVIDGGLAQLSTAIKFQKRVGLAIPLVSVVKDERHKAREILGFDKALVSLRSDLGLTRGQTFSRQLESEILLANSESHRFAIAFHKQKRSKNFLK